MINYSQEMHLDYETDYTLQRNWTEQKCIEQLFNIYIVPLPIKGVPQINATSARTIHAFISFTERCT